MRSNMATTAEKAAVHSTAASSTLDRVTFGTRLRAARKQLGWARAHVGLGVTAVTNKAATRGADPA